MDERLFIIKILLRDGRREEVFKEVWKIKDFYWCFYVFWWVVESYVYEFEKVFEVVSEIEEYLIKDEIFVFFFYFFLREGEFKKVLEVVRFIKD